MIDRPRPDDPLGVLTGAPAQVLALMAEGRSNAAIEERLTISEKAVVRHASNIYVVVGRVADRAGTEDPEGARLQRSGVVAQEPAHLAAPPLHVDGAGDLRGRTVLGGVGDEYLVTPPACRAPVRAPIAEATRRLRETRKHVVCRPGWQLAAPDLRCSDHDSISRPSRSPDPCPRGRRRRRGARGRPGAARPRPRARQHRTAGSRRRLRGPAVVGPFALHREAGPASAAGAAPGARDRPSPRRARRRRRASHTVRTTDGGRLGYDRLVVATGARSVDGVPGATTFSGPLSAGVVEGAARGARARAVHRAPRRRVDAAAV